MNGLLLRAAMLAGLVLASAFGAERAMAQEANAATAFSNLVEAGNYDKANFYITNGFVTADSIDASQLFFDVLMAKYSRDMPANAASIDNLYNYLGAIEAIDLNRAMSCGRRKQDRCLLVNNLMTGADRDTFAYFVDRGLDLNLRVEGMVPAPVPLLLRLGTNYDIEDLNFLVSKGMVLGDELYPIEELANYSDDYARQRRLNMPGDYLYLGAQNFLDVMIIALGTEIRENPPRKSLRQKTLCEFVTHASASFSPSFDYLLYLLQANEEFRGTNIAKMEKSGNSIYQPFPPPCVSLIQAMASSHGELQQVISRFAGQGDVETADWLIGITDGAG